MTDAVNAKKALLPGVLVALLAAGSAPVQAFSLGDFLGGSSASDSSATAPASSGLTDILAGQISNTLGVSKSQAAAGIGLLVSYASTSLPDTYASQLKALLPSAATSGTGGSLLSQLSSQVDSMSDVNKGFEALGMDSSMVDSFTPLLESAVANTGASDLAAALGKLW